MCNVFKVYFYNFQHILPMSRRGSGNNLQVKMDMEPMISQQSQQVILRMVICPIYIATEYDKSDNSMWSVPHTTKHDAYFMTSVST